MSRARHEAERLAGPLPPLVVEAERIAAGIAPGLHGRRRAGPGDTFWQYRRYQAGDPARLVDWRRSARSPHIHVRETEWEAAQTVHLWADPSPSMAWASRRDLPAKGERARLLLLALAALLLRGGERAALLGDRGAPAVGRGGLARLAARLEAGTPAEPAAATVPRHGATVLIGDFLDPPRTLHARLRALAARGARVRLLQVLDPAEESLPYSGRVRFEGPEGEGAVLLGRVDAVRDAYVRRLSAHRDALRALAAEAGGRLVVHHTDQPARPALLALHQGLAGGRGC